MCREFAILNNANTVGAALAAMEQWCPSRLKSLLQILVN